MEFQERWFAEIYKEYGNYQEELRFYAFLIENQPPGRLTQRELKKK